MKIHEVKKSITLIDPDRINTEPGPYCMSFGFDIKPLRLSIENFGIINPPYILKETNGKINIAMGYKRILAMRELYWDEIPCFDLTGSGLQPFEVLLLNLNDNLGRRSFNEVEKGMVLNRLKYYVSEKKILERYMPLLNLPSYHETLMAYLNIENLPDSVKWGIVKKDVSIETVNAVAEMDKKVRDEIYGRILILKLNLNQQKHFLEYIMDIAKKERIEIHEIFHETWFSDIIENKKLNNPQKKKLILGNLRSRRFPRLVAAENSFQERINNLSWPHGVCVTHPRFFESPDYKVEITFKDGKELKEKIGSLYHLGGIEKICDPPDE